MEISLPDVCGAACLSSVELGAWSREVAGIYSGSINVVDHKLFGAGDGRSVFSYRPTLLQTRLPMQEVALAPCSNLPAPSSLKSAACCRRRQLPLPLLRLRRCRRGI